MPETASVVVLAGGTGGAKLARGMLEVVEHGRLTVIANTGDDAEIYGAHVSPDPDLVTFWLADRIDARGWGLEGDSFAVMEGLRELGDEVWFNLGDRDLAIGIQRAAALASGTRLTEAHAALVQRMGVAARVLPMSDQPVRTRVQAGGRWWTLQELLIKARGQGEIEDVQFRGAGAAAATPEVLEAIASADAIVIGPSNPIISIGPILAVPELRAALLGSAAPVVAVSPLVGGQVLKGPTAAFMRWAGAEVSAAGLAKIYDGLLDGLVCDEPLDLSSAGDGRRVATLQADLLMDTPPARRRLAARALAFARELTATAPLTHGDSRRGPRSSSFPRK